jgi:ADP-ribose pyrophosphatase
MPETEETIASEVVYQGPRITVRHERVRLADGTEIARDIVDQGNAVVILAIDDDEQVLFVRQYRTATNSELLELPAGGIEEGEEPQEAALRELREETGYAAGRLVKLGMFYAAPGTYTELLHSFLALDLREDPLPADDDERIEVERMTFDEAMAAAREGKLHDSKTLATMLLAVTQLGGEDD